VWKKLLRRHRRKFPILIVYLQGIGRKKTILAHAQGKLAEEA
jgi:hypothetical protein